VRTLVAIALVAAAGSQPVPLHGTVTLGAVNSAKNCRFSGGATVLTALCHQSGPFAGKPRAADAAYSWRWDLELGKDGNTTGNATEAGTLTLDFGGLGVLRVTTRGRQVPVGIPSRSSARGRTTGRWTFKSGTKSFAGRHGSGTYVFETARTGPTTFQVARLTLSGSLP
jgi:hypothetical protein